MDVMLLITSSLLFLAILVIFIGLGRAVRHVTYVTLADGRRSERSLPLTIRMVLPFCLFIPKFITGLDAFEETRERLGRKIVSAGFEGLVKPHEVIALRLLMPAGPGLLFCLLMYLCFPYMPDNIGRAFQEGQFVIYAVILVAFGFLPDSWLARSIRKRHKSIERALPFVLDLLTLAVESGLDFMSGIQRIISHREIDPLGEELIRVFREIQVGRTRKEALKNMSARVDHVDIRAVTNALIQADELGSGIAHALRVQADQIRVKRFQRAEKMGNEAPVKLLFPLMAFIFPSVFLILLGPVILQMWIRGGF